ncbi:FERM domain-containing protein 4A [Mactra antiquata]
MTDSDSDVVSPAQSPLVPRGPRSNYKQHDDRPGHPNSPLHRSNTAPKDLLKEREIVSMTLPPTHSSHTLDDVYKPNSVYSNQYRNQTYPTLSGRGQGDYDSKSGSHGYQDGSNQGHLDGYDTKFSQHSGLNQGRLEGSRDSGFSSTNNMYNVGSRRTSRYESNQDLVTPGGESQYDTLDNVFDNRLKIHSKPSSTDSSGSQMQKSYGSLERNMKKRQNHTYERKLSDTDASVDSSGTAPNRFGKRTSRSEYDLSSKGRDYPVSSKETDYPLVNQLKDYLDNSTSQKYSSLVDKMKIDKQDSAAGHRMIEVPVRHETMNSSSQRPSLDFNSQSNNWRDSASTEPSPIIQSPVKQNNSESYISSSSNISNIDDSPTKGQCYSPRGFEGSRAAIHSKPPHPEHKVRVNVIDSSHGTPQATSSKIVTVKMSPHVEVSKPFEMKDFYKYSEKLRRQRLVEQYHQALVGSRVNSPSHHSSDGDSHHSTSYHHSGTPSTPHSSAGSQYGGSTPTSVHPAYRGTSTSSNSPIGSPVSSRHMTSSHPYPSSSYHDNSNYSNSWNVTTSSTSSTAPNYGVSTTTSRVQYTVQTQGGRVLYKAQHQSSKQTHYQPPTSMKCEPVKSSRDLRSGSHEAPATPTGSRTGGIHHQRQYSTPERSVVSPMNMSNFHLSPAGSLSKAFSSEMLEWYDGEGNQAPTSV